MIVRPCTILITSLVLPGYVLGSVADAAIHYSGPQNRFVQTPAINGPSDVENLDINGDGATDFRLIADNIFDGQFFFMERGFFLNGNGVNRSVAGVTSTEEASKLSAGSPISVSLNFINESELYVLRNPILPEGMFTGHGFAGLKFPIGAATHYGWLELNVDNAAGRATALGWAYDDVPGQSIAAGVGLPPSALAGDFDRDNDVDGSDFLKWQYDLGLAVTPIGAGADGDSDGTVDGDDLAFWRNGFGDTAAMPAAATIPEPRSLDLCLLVVIAGLAVARSAPITLMR
jgi:hypothetical protein